MRLRLIFLIIFCFVLLNACQAMPVPDNKIQQKQSSASESNSTSDSTTTGNDNSASDSSSTVKSKATSDSNRSGSTNEAKTPPDNTDAEKNNQSTSPVDPSSLSNTLMAWWFMRTEDHSQPSAEEEIDLSKYDAWYVKPDLKGDTGKTDITDPQKNAGKSEVNDSLKNIDKPIFLTFDCGYENGFTPKILEVLKKHKAPAAFFVCRHFIEDQPDLIKQMKEDGHIVGNHTANHICMPKASEREIRKEIADNAAFMKETTGYEMDPFFRPPKGEYSERTLQITKDMGYTTVFWSLAYVDYDVDKQPGAQYVIDHFNKYIHPGAIPLIHNISRSNAEALDAVLTNLEQAGYSFHSLEELRGLHD